MTKIDRAHDNYRMLEFDGKGDYRVTHVRGAHWSETEVAIKPATRTTAAVVTLKTSRSQGDGSILTTWGEQRSNDFASKASARLDPRGTLSFNVEQDNGDGTTTVVTTTPTANGSKTTSTTRDGDGNVTQTTTTEMSRPDANTTVTTTTTTDGDRTIKSHHHEYGLRFLPDDVRIDDS